MILWTTMLLDWDLLGILKLVMKKSIYYQPNPTRFFCTIGISCVHILSMENFIWLEVRFQKFFDETWEKNILGEVPESENSTFTKQMPRRRFEVSETEYKQLEDLPFSFSSGNTFSDIILYLYNINFRYLLKLRWWKYFVLRWWPCWRVKWYW